jgi:hypothetical protein
MKKQSHIYAHKSLLVIIKYLKQNDKILNFKPFVFKPQKFSKFVNMVTYLGTTIYLTKSMYTIINWPDDLKLSSKTYC